jgi:mannose-6-phosphate isomerase-like protein (cupin superfamily)
MSDIFYDDIEKSTILNDTYRKVVYTGKMQFVYMSIKPLDDIHNETHFDNDQFLKIEHGEGNAILNGISYKLYNGIGLIIPAGVEHRIINSSSTEPLKLYTIYSPPEHKKDTIQLVNPDKIYIQKYVKYKNKYLKSKNI